MVPRIFITTFPLLILFGCGPRGISGDAGGEQGESGSESGQSESESGQSDDTGDGDGDGDNDPWDRPNGDPVACECDDEQLCVISEWGCEIDDGEKPFASCMDTPAECMRGNWTCEIDDPCARALCGPWAACGPWSCDDAEGYDILCYEPRYCDPFEDSCFANQKCVPWSWNWSTTWNSSACIEIEGTDAPGTPCVANDPILPDSCDASSVCWTANIVDTPKPATCRAFCGGTPTEPSCPDGQHCLLAESDRVAICLDACDPLQPNCANDEVCAWISTGFVCVDEVYAGGPVGEPCGWVNDCTAGNACIVADSLDGCMGAQCCTSYCDVEVPDPCDGEHTCRPLFEAAEAPPGMANVGVCALPGSQPVGVPAAATGLPW